MDDPNAFNLTAATMDPDLLHEALCDLFLGSNEYNGSLGL